MAGDNYDWTKDPSLSAREPRTGFIPGLKKVAGSASSLMDLFFQAKQLAKADDAKRAKTALEEIAKTRKA